MGDHGSLEQHDERRLHPIVYPQATATKGENA
jgi:hypothetical protein